MTERTGLNPRTTTPEPAKDRKRPHPAGAAVITLVVLAVLCAQSAVSGRIYRFFPKSSFFEISRPPALWPFLTYPMYSTRHKKGETFSHYRLYAVIGDQKDVAIRPDDLGVNFFHFRDDLIEAALNEDHEKVASYMAEYRKKHDKTVSALRIESRSFVLTENGFEPLETEVVAEYSLPADEEGF